MLISISRARTAIVFAFIGCAIGAGHALGATPSFLCGRSNVWIEKTICASDRLSELDLEMATVYSRALRIPDAQTLRRIQVEQHKWWGERTRCQREADSEACVERIYTERMSALRADPSYPGDKPYRAPRIVKEVAISDVGQGWSRHLSGYYKAIKRCVSESKSQVQAVLKAWSEDQGESVTMWLQGAEDQLQLCTALKNGKQLKVLRSAKADEEAPTGEPTLYLEPARNLTCTDAVAVLAPDGQAFGQLSAEPCTVKPM